MHITHPTAPFAPRPTRTVKGKRNLTITQFSVYAAAIAIAVWGAACSSDSATAPQKSEVDKLRASLAPYTSLALAQGAGYDVALTDCMSNGDIGAMGIHYGKPALIDASLDATQPEVLIYEPGPSGSMSLVGVEFVVPFALAPKSGPAPSLFGQRFIPDDVFGLWTLHVWTHRTNPNGTFAQWNPRVHCS
jgi:hypothetical protein